MEKLEDFEQIQESKNTENDKISENEKSPEGNELKLGEKLYNIVEVNRFPHESCNFNSFSNFKKNCFYIINCFQVFTGRKCIFCPCVSLICPKI